MSNLSLTGKPIFDGNLMFYVGTCRVGWVSKRERSRRGIPCQHRKRLTRCLQLVGRREIIEGATRKTTQRHQKVNGKRRPAAAGPLGELATSVSNRLTHSRDAMSFTLTPFIKLPCAVADFCHRDGNLSDYLSVRQGLCVGFFVRTGMGHSVLRSNHA